MRSHSTFFKSENKRVNPPEPSLLQRTIAERIQKITQNFPTESELNHDSKLPAKTFEGTEIAPDLLKKTLGTSLHQENSVQRYLNSFKNQSAPLSYEALYLLLQTILIAVGWETKLFMKHPLVKQLFGESHLAEGFICLHQLKLLNRDNFKILYTMHREDRAELCILLNGEALFSLINSRQINLIKKILPYSLPCLYDLIKMFSIHAADSVTRQDIHDLFALTAAQMKQLHEQMVDILLAEKLSLLPMRIGCLKIAGKINDGLIRLLQFPFFDMNQALEMIRAGAHPHLADNDGNTVLHKIIYKLVKGFMPPSCIQTIQEIVRIYHADLNVKNHANISAWHIFVAAKNPEHIPYALNLVELGADFQIMAHEETNNPKSSYIDMLVAQRTKDPLAKKMLNILTKKYECTLNEHYKIPAHRHINRKDITTKKKSIGSGAFSQVYRGDWNGRSIAIKNMPVYQFEQFANEIKDLNHLWSRNAPYIIQLYGYHMSLSAGTLSIFLELATLGSLDRLYEKASVWELALRLRLIEQLIAGLAWIHKELIIHCDLKSKNVVVDGNQTIKIIDFGLSTKPGVVPSVDEKPVGTFLYMAPELLTNKKRSNTFASDIYGLGFTICEIIGWKFIFHLMNLNDDYSEDQLAEDIVVGFRPKIPADCPAFLGKLIPKTWKENPAERPTIEQLQQEYQTGLRPG